MLLPDSLSKRECNHDRFQAPLGCNKDSTMPTSEEKAFKCGNGLKFGLLGIHGSSKKLILFPQPTLKHIPLARIDLVLRIPFHCQEWIFFLLHLIKEVFGKYLAFTALTHSKSVLVSSAHLSLNNIAMLTCSNFLMPRPPKTLGVQIEFQDIGVNLGRYELSLQRKLQVNLSMLLH